MCRVVMEGKEIESESRYPLSSVTHSECKSFLRSLVKDVETDLVLYSDGSLEIDENTSFVEKPRAALTMSEIKSVHYHGGRYINRTEYKIMNLISSICGILSIYFAPSLVIGILWADSGIFTSEFFQIPIPVMVVLHFIPILCWALFDLYRGDIAIPERIDFSKSDGSSVEVFGELPEGSMHEVGTGGVFLGAVISLLIFFIWVIEQAPLSADVLAFLLGVMIVWKVMIFVNNYFSKPEGVSQPQLDEVPNGLSHMYFAALSFQNKNKLDTTPNQEIELREELNEVKKKLKVHDEIIKSLASASDIFSAPSPSLGVLAIRVSTEKLMKRGCEVVGVKMRSNARPTLDTYINSFQTKQKLDSKILSYLEDIRNMGNRAGHDFNLEWDEFMVTLNRFCEIVAWYSENFLVVEISVKN